MKEKSIKKIIKRTLLIWLAISLISVIGLHAYCILRLYNEVGTGEMVRYFEGDRLEDIFLNPEPSVRKILAGMIATESYVDTGEEFLTKGGILQSCIIMDDSKNILSEGPIMIVGQYRNSSVGQTIVGMIPMEQAFSSEQMDLLNSLYADTSKQYGTECGVRLESFYKKGYFIYPKEMTVYNELDETSELSCDGNYTVTDDMEFVEGGNLWITRYEPYTAEGRTKAVKFRSYLKKYIEKNEIADGTNNIFKFFGADMCYICTAKQSGFTIVWGQKYLLESSIIYYCMIAVAVLLAIAVVVDLIIILARFGKGKKAALLLPLFIPLFLFGYFSSEAADGMIKDLPDIKMANPQPNGAFCTMQEYIDNNTSDPASYLTDELEYIRPHELREITLNKENFTILNPGETSVKYTDCVLVLHSADGSDKPADVDVVFNIDKWKASDFEALFAKLEQKTADGAPVKYGQYSVTDGQGYKEYKFSVKGTEKNLFDTYPIYTYLVIIDSDGTISKFNIKDAYINSDDYLYWYVQ